MDGALQHSSNFVKVICLYCGWWKEHSLLLYKNIQHFTSEIVARSTVVKTGFGKHVRMLLQTVNIKIESRKWHTISIFSITLLSCCFLSLLTPLEYQWRILHVIRWYMYDKHKNWHFSYLNSTWGDLRWVSTLVG